MEYFISTARELANELEQLHFSEPDIMVRTQKAVKLISGVIAEFREKIRTEGFTNKEEEIHFFKFIKPHINSYLIFFTILSDIEEQKMHLSKEDLKVFINKKERMFRHIMREHLEFVKYYRCGQKDKDDTFFVRGANMDFISRFSNFQMNDPEFNTSHDHIAANIMAFDLFQRHFNPGVGLSKQPTSSNLKWTATKLDLVELIYALQASGAINKGNADLKEIASMMENIFQIQIGDLYRAFHDISNRKKEQIKFVNKLEGELERKILELEGMF